MEWLYSKLDFGGGPEVDQFIKDKYGILLRLSGVYPYLRNGLWKFSLVQLIFNSVTFCFFGYCFLQTVIHGKEDLGIVSHAIHYLLIDLFTISVICSLVLNRKNLNKIHLAVKAKYFQYIEKFEIEELNKRKNDYKIFRKKLLIVVIGYFITTITCLICVPLIEKYFGFKRKEIEGIDMRMPVPFWHPFSREDPIVLFSLLLYSTYGAALVGLVVCSVNTLIIYIFSGVLLQFKILQKSIELLPQRAELIHKILYPRRNSTHRGVQVQRSANTKITKDQLTKCYIFCLKESIEHQIVLEKVIKMTMSAVNIPAVIGFVIGSIIIAISLLASVMGDPNPSVFILSALFVIVEAAEMAMACHCGQMCIDQNEILRNALYDLNWSSFPKEVSKFVKIMMEKAKRPVKFKAGGIFLLNNATLTNALQSTYSYFNLLLAFYRKRV